MGDVDGDGDDGGTGQPRAGAGEALTTRHYLPAIYLALIWPPTPQPTNSINSLSVA
jgi:hypothetical protein